MSLYKYQTLVNGMKRLVAFTVQSAGSASAGQPVALGSDGKLDPSVYGAGVGIPTTTCTAFEQLNSGKLVDLFYDTATNPQAPVLKARLADGSVSGKESQGFVLASISPGGAATVYRFGDNTGLSGLTPGVRYYLSASTPGGITDTPLDPTDLNNAGKLHQFVGEATAAGTLSYVFEDGIVL